MRFGKVISEIGDAALLLLVGGTLLCIVIGGLSGAAVLVHTAGWIALSPSVFHTLIWSTAVCMALLVAGVGVYLALTRHSVDSTEEKR